MEITLWNQMMTNRYYRRFHNYVYWLYHHDELLTKQLNGHHKCNQSLKIHYSFIQMILPGIMTGILCIGCALFVLLPDHLQSLPFIKTLGSFFPTQGQKYLCSVMGIWCASITAIKFYDLFTGFKKYGFLHILHLKQSKGRNLNSEQLQRLRSFRNQLFSLSRAIITLIYLFVFIAFGSMAIMKAWKYSLFGAIFWYLQLLNAALHGCVGKFCFFQNKKKSIFIVCLSGTFFEINILIQVLYHTPMIIVVCQYYLQLKQQSLNNKLEKLYNQLIKQKQHDSAIKSDQYWINLRFNNELTKINKFIERNLHH